MATSWHWLRSTSGSGSGALGGAIRWRYWPRLIFALGCSLAATVLTLPERLLFSFWIRRRRSDLAGNASKVGSAPLFILGYYRSGTTHLHYLLDCDPKLRSPRWVEALAPQGFVLSWALLRLILTPFVPLRRPMDGVAFGLELPAEDDFALNNWTLASSLAGRLVLPAACAFYDRFDDLRALKDAELERWQRCLRDFVYKVSLVAGGRRLLLKSPSHTARVKEFLRLFSRREIHPRLAFPTRSSALECRHGRDLSPDASPPGRST